MATPQTDKSQGNNTKVSDTEMRQGITSQVNWFIFVVIMVLIIAVLILASKMFRVWLCLNRMEIYKSNELKQRSITDISNISNTSKLRDFYIASAYRPYVCYYHKYDYVSLEVFKQVLAAGPRMVELEVFNSDYGDKVEPVVSVGEEVGDWTYTLNSIPLKSFFKVIASHVFNSQMVGQVHKDPFILFLNLKTNRNVKCLNKIHKYLYDELGRHLLSSNYSYNARENDNIRDITLATAKGKVIVFASGDFEESNLTELINYSIASNYTLKNKKNQRRILYLNQKDIVETEEDIEDYVNPEHHKLDKEHLKEYNKHSFSILSPQIGEDSLFDGISPVNFEAGKGLESGCQFIMMNYQKIDTNMSNYVYLFKDSSFVHKQTEQISAYTSTNVVFEGGKVEEVKLSLGEINYLYTMAIK